MQAQQLELKLYSDGDGFDQAELIPIFHRWIQDNRLGDDVLLIDVADYTHVPEGPGVMLVADGAQWRMDEADSERGMLFARRRDPLGPVADKLREALAHLLRACQALESEAALSGRARFRTDRLRVTVMSRRAASGDAASFAQLEAPLREFVSSLWGDAEVTVRQVNGEREALAAEVTAGATASVGELLARLT